MILRNQSARAALFTGLVGLLLLSAPVAASAENLPKILPEGVPALDDESLERLHAATARLYDGRSIGNVERWRNPDTGDAGSVKLLGKSTLKGMPCRRMAYMIQPKHASTSPEHMQNYVMTWCKTASGDWKIAENARPQ